MRVRKEVKILVGILVLAIFLRGVNLARNFEGDEIYHATLAENVVNGRGLKTLDFSSRQDRGRMTEYTIPKRNPYRQGIDHPPFDVLLFTLFAGLPFSQEISLRLLPFFGGILAIIFTYLIGKKIFNERVGLISSFLESISTYHLFHSSFILESDAIISFLVPLSFFLYVRWKEREGRRIFYLMGISLGLIVLTKITGVFFLGFILFYELLRKKFSEIGILLIVVGLMLGIWGIYDHFVLTDVGWINGVLKHGLPKIEGGIDLSQRAYKIVYSTGILMEELTTPLCVLFLLAFVSVVKDVKISGKLNVKKTLHRYDVMLLLWILLNSIYFLNGGGDPQRYFSIAVPFLFILVAKFISEFKWRKDYIVTASLLFLLIGYFFQINDYQFYTYLVYQSNLMTLIMWSLPFIFLFLYLVKNFRELTVSILLGAYLGASLYFILFSTATWPVAISQATTYISQEKNANFIVSKSWYVLESSMYYDWVKDGRLDKRYFRIPLEEIKKFDEENKENCEEKNVRGYPLVFLCKNFPKGSGI